MRLRRGEKSGKATVADNRKRSGGTRPTSGGGGGRKAPARPGLPPGIRSDIYGISLTVLAVALVIAVLTEEYPLPAAVAEGLGLVFGVGRYVVAIFVLLWAVSFFFERFQMDEWRIGGGLGLAFLSIIAMVSLAARPDLDPWAHDTLVAAGGYAGGGVAYGLKSVLGPVISYVVLAGTLAIGLVLATGTKIEDLYRRIADWFATHEDAVRPHRGARAGAGSRTVPMRDLDGDTEFTEKPEPPVRPRDPEAERRTIPTVRAVPPRKLDGFVLPPLSMLKTSPQAPAGSKATDKELRSTAQLIESTLATFDIPARVETWVAGPTVTLFEVKIAKGVKVNRVTALSDDLALALAAQTVRVLAPIPGKSLIGIEVPNERRTTVTLGDVLVGASIPDTSPLMLGIGKDVGGERIVLDLAAMPHLLIAGSTGTGKSVCINALLTSMIMRTTPAEVRLILIDPKRIELSLYNEVPHLYGPVVTEAKEAASALAWAVSEMESRLRRLQKASARNIGMFNTMVHDGKAPEGFEAMPYIVIVIDELADLMMVAAREVEDSICRLAQLARAAGIHLVVATQRPSTDIITGLIKTNITHRIAFMVGSSIDSRVILDQTGAERLVGLGDMLLSTPALAKAKRIQGAFVTEEEIVAVVEHLKRQAEPDYHEEILHLKVLPGGGGLDIGSEDDDPLIWEAADIVVTSRIGSTSLLQRRLKVGYARAGRIMDMLEQRGLVGPPDGSKPREVLADIEELESIKAFERDDAREADE
jgi:S-DNA-T family DNA segregation ATPase FtsK/SpoIIIE